MFTNPYLIAGILFLTIVWLLPRKGLSPLVGLGLILISFVLPILVLPLVLAIALFNKPKIATGFKKSKNIAPSTVLCPKCGTENPPNSTSCKTCDNQLSLTS